jgi:hypothetical protein
MKAKRKPKTHRDKKGEYIKRGYFVGGRQKFVKVYVIDGIPADEWYEKNADPMTLLQNGDFDLLHARGF